MDTQDAVDIQCQHHRISVTEQLHALLPSGVLLLMPTSRSPANIGGFSLLRWMMALHECRSTGIRCPLLLMLQVLLPSQVSTAGFQQFPVVP